MMNARIHSFLKWNILVLIGFIQPMFAQSGHNCDTSWRHETKPGDSDSWYECTRGDTTYSVHRVETEKYRLRFDLEESSRLRTLTSAPLRVQLKIGELGFFGDTSFGRRSSSFEPWVAKDSIPRSLFTRTTQLVFINCSLLSSDHGELWFGDDTAHSDLPPLPIPFRTSFDEGFGISMGFGENEFVPAIFARFGMRKLSFQVNFLSTTILKDEYNEGHTSVSVFPYAGMIPAIFGGFYTGHRGEGGTLLPDSGFLRPILRIMGYSLIIAYILPNSELHYSILASDKGGAGNFNASLFAGSRFDWFIPEKIKWVRFAPRAGIEGYFQLQRDDDYGYRFPMALGVQFGVTRYWDYSSWFNNVGSYQVFLGSCIYFQ